MSRVFDLAHDLDLRVPVQETTELVPRAPLADAGFSRIRALRPRRSPARVLVLARR